MIAPGNQNDLQNTQICDTDSQASTGLQEFQMYTFGACEYVPDVYQSQYAEPIGIAYDSYHVESPKSSETMPFSSKNSTTHGVVSDEPEVTTGEHDRPVNASRIQSTVIPDNAVTVESPESSETTSFSVKRKTIHDVVSEEP